MQARCGAAEASSITSALSGYLLAIQTTFHSLLDLGVIKPFPAMHEYAVNQIHSLVRGCLNMQPVLRVQTTPD